jgi:hypothetical protein
MISSNDKTVGQKFADDYRADAVSQRENSPTESIASSLIAISWQLAEMISLFRDSMEKSKKDDRGGMLLEEVRNVGYRITEIGQILRNNTP